MSEPKAHVYQPDPSLRRDWSGFTRCSQCGLPKRNRHHEVPEVPADVRRLDARRAGEQLEDHEEEIN